MFLLVTHDIIIVNGNKLTSGNIGTFLISPNALIKIIIAKIACIKYTIFPGISIGNKANHKSNNWISYLLILILLLILLTCQYGFYFQNKIYKMKPTIIKQPQYSSFFYA